MMVIVQDGPGKSSIENKEICNIYKINNVIMDKNKCDLVNFEIIWSHKKLHIEIFKPFSSRLTNKRSQRQI